MKIILYLFVFAVLFVIYVRYLEQKSVFYPLKNIMATPESAALHYEDVYFQTKAGIKLNGWFVEGINSSGKVMLFFHGNAGNIGDRITKINYFARMGVDVFIIDYKGYGRSEGTPSEQGLYEDAIASYDYLVNKKGISSERIFVYGVSLGGAVAIDLVSKKEVAGLIVDSSFSNAKDMAKRIMPFVPPFLVKTKLDSSSKVGSIKKPKLFLHSPQDEVVPYVLGRKLFDSAVEPKEFIDLDGGHNDNHVVDESKYRQIIKNFIDSL